MTDLQLIKLSIERLKILGYGRQKDIGAMLGYSSESAFSQVLNNKVNTPPDLLERISNLDANIKNFILSYKDSGITSVPEKDIIEMSNPLITKTNAIVMRSKSLIPFYNADFMAGKSDVFYEDGSEHPDYYMDVPEFYGCIAFKAFGDSMDPIIKSGCILFGSKMDEDWKVSLEYGQIYGITMLNGRRYLKYVRKATDHKNMFLLKSANKEYDDFEISKDKIKNLWLIQGWIDKRA